MASLPPFFEHPDYKRSFADVPIDGTNIHTSEFIEACQTLVIIFDYLKSAAFSPVKSDISGNVAVCPMSLAIIIPCTRPRRLTVVFTS